MGDHEQATKDADTVGDSGQLAAIPCPLERAAAACRLARQVGTLSPVVAQIRRLAIVELLATQTAAQVAAALRLTRPRISQLRREPAGCTAMTGVSGSVSLHPDDDMPVGASRPRTDRSWMEA